MINNMVVNTVTDFITTHTLITPGSTIILGFSGGPDSTFLLQMLATLRTPLSFNLIAVHLNHGWRANAQKDVDFCAAMAEKLGVPFIAAHASDFAALVKDRGSQEDRGRQMRRLFFEHVAQKHSSPTIALAHHLDDQIETFLVRLIRGASIEGLTSMHPRQGMYIRPLLCIHKQEILKYLQREQIPYLEDPTNMQGTNLRSRIRTILIPAFETTDPRYENSILKTIDHLTQADNFLSDLTHTAFKKVSRQMVNGILLDLHKWRDLPPFLRTPTIIEWLVQEKLPFTHSKAFFMEVEKFLMRPTGGMHWLLPQWRMFKKGPWAYLIKN